MLTSASKLSGIAYAVESRAVISVMGLRWAVAGGLARFDYVRLYTPISGCHSSPHPTVVGGAQSLGSSCSQLRTVGDIKNTQTHLARDQWRVGVRSRGVAGGGQEHTELTIGGLRQRAL